ncbi:MAG: hypothetical protein U0586_04080 [Candidatus Brocadiaceae bacterium]
MIEKPETQETSEVLVIFPTQFRLLGNKQILEPELQKALYNNRLLLISPFGEDVKRVTRETSNQRNRFMAELADEIVVAYASQGGNIEKIIADILHKVKTISSFKTI